MVKVESDIYCPTVVTDAMVDFRFVIFEDLVRRQVSYLVLDGM